MGFLQWEDKFSVKIERIDSQHKMLISMVEEFYERINEKSNEDLIGELIAKMKDYTIDHFNTEEALFDKYNYPDAEEHKKEHAEFIAKVADLEKRLQNGKLIISFEITDFLKKWLLKHINGSDKKYSKFLVAQGEK
jgi:hemerythrin